MTINQLIPLVIAISIFLTVFALGLDAELEDATWLFRRPELLARSIFSMNVLMVVLAIIAAKLLSLDLAVETAIIALAISPVPPIFPKKQKKVGATNPYAIALLTSASLVSVVLIPAWLEALGAVFGFEAHLAIDKVLSTISLRILLPLFMGIIFHRIAPQLAGRAVRLISLIATVLLVLGVLPVLFTSYRAMWAMVGNGVLGTFVVFALVGIAVGHLLGGPDPDDRSVLALATSTRHPGIAIAIAAINFPERSKAVLIVVLFHLIVGTIVAIPYMKWRKKVHSSLAESRGL